jgi:hypothetical protein
MTPLMLILTGLIGALAAVVAYLWPQLMTVAREHLLPWVDSRLPELAPAVRLAFHDLDKIAVEWRHAVRAAWRKLRDVLIWETATFVRSADGDWIVRITSSVRNSAEEEEKAVTTTVKEHLLDWRDLPEELRKQALLNGLDGTSIDILHARDLLLTDTA